jgi:hypothetical protein
MRFKHKGKTTGVNDIAKTCGALKVLPVMITKHTYQSKKCFECMHIISFIIDLYCYKTRRLFKHNYY